MTKHTWEGVHNPDKPYVPINEAPDHTTELNPEERTILLDLYEKGLLGEMESELAEELLGIVTDKTPQLEDEDHGGGSEMEDRSRGESVTLESPEIEEYEESLSPVQQKNLSGVRRLLRETRRSGRGDKKRNWESVPNSNRSTIRKPSPDGDVRLRDGV